MCSSRRFIGLCFLLIVSCCMVGKLVGAQRDNDDDFDDSGFDDSGYSNNQPSRDAEESNQNPSNYSPANEEDLDDDDDVDETRQVSQQEPSSSSSSRMNGNPNSSRQRMRQQQQQQFYANVAPQPFYAPPNSVLLAGFDPTQSAAMYGPGQHQARYRRSVAAPHGGPEKDIEDSERPEGKILSRRKRYAKKKSYIGPVYTYVKTDKHAHYKWGVKHKVGKHYGR